MFILLLFICIIATGITWVRISKIGFDNCFGSFFIAVIAFIGVIGFSTTIAIGVGNILSESAIVNQIAIIEEENEEMNIEIKATVMSTLDKESEIYKEFANSQSTSSTMTLVLKYPELKSIDLINSYIDIYRKNKDEVKKKKMELANIGTWRKLIYFGKPKYNFKEENNT